MLSVCMIVRNEEKELVSFLKNVGPHVDEIIAVDTGSKDRSRRILSKHPKVKLLHFRWVDDFAAARNFSLEAATGDWILVMDADERIEEPKLISKLLEGDDVDAYNVCIRNLQPKGSLTRYELSYLPRLFRNKGYRYEGMVHEQISPSIHAKDGRRVTTNWTIVHHGYMNDVVQGKESRQKRNIALIRRQLQETPDDFYYLFHLGLAYKNFNEAQSEHYFLKSLSKGAAEMPPHLKEQVFMRLAQLKLGAADHQNTIVYAQKSLEIAPNNIISRVCLITALCSVKGFVQANPHLAWVIEHHLDVVPNPDDFIQLYKAIQSLI